MTSIVDTPGGSPPGSLVVEAADVLVGNPICFLGRDFWRSESDGGIAGNENCPTRVGSVHRIGPRSRPQKGDLQVIPDNHGEPQQELSDVWDLFLAGNALIRLDRRQ